MNVGTTYYWRIDEISGPNTITGDVWSFTTLSGEAKNPNPENGAINVDLNNIIDWTAGPAAASHDVYFGTTLNDVTGIERILADINGNGIADWKDLGILGSYWLADPTGTEPFAGIDDDSIVDFIDYSMFSQDWLNLSGPVFKGNQETNSFDPGTLDLNTTYYWRVDEVNGPDTVKGPVWSFTTQSGKAYNPNPAIGASNVLTTAALNWTAGSGACIT